MKKLNNAAARPVNRRRHAFHGLAMATTLAVVGCGGGSGEGSGEASGTAPPITETPAVLSGVVATGAPLAGAKLRVVDAGGAEVCRVDVGAQGEYNCTLAPGAKGPLALTASTAEQTLYSVAPTAEGGTANVTPLTTLIVSRLSPNGNPAQFADQLRGAPDLATKEKLDTLVAELQTLLAPLQKAAGDKGVNPLSGTFAADGTGHDRLLDALQVSIRPEDKVANIEVTMKVKPDSDAAAPVKVAFQSSDKTLPPPPGQTLDLADSGIAAQVADFLKRMDACYKLPLDQRISGVASGATIAAGGPAAVQAPACKSLFLNDNPADFLDNGVAVGGGGAFPGMFRETSTGTTFDLGNFEYLRANGDVYIIFRSLSTGGAPGYSALTLRKQDGKLKAVGNQYRYAASVAPYVSQREFPRQPEFSSLMTGYNMNITNAVDGNGQMLFNGAKVTTPDGRTLHLRTLAGRSQMAIVRDNTTTSTSTELVAGAFVNPATAGDPGEKDASLVFTPTRLSDAEIRSIPDQGVWTVEWEHADPGKPNVTQHYRTISRAPTLGELRRTPLVQFSPAFKDDLLARSDVQANRGLEFADPSAESPNVANVALAGGGDAWIVPDGATAPTRVNVYGRTPWPENASFNNGVSLAAGARSAVVRCSAQSAGDTHCDDTTGTPQFAAGSRLWTFELWGRTIRQVEQTAHIGLWKLAE